jgi:UPF0755 protein
MSEDRPRPPRRPGQPPNGSRRPPDRKKPAPDPYDYDAIFEEDLGPEPTLKDRIPGTLVKRVGAVVAVMAFLLIGFTWVHGQIDPSKSGDEINVEVPSGASFSDVASLLEQKKVVPSAFFLKVWAKLHGTPNVKAGEFAFNENSSDGNVLAVLAQGPKASTNKLVIPEGFRLTQIAARVGAIPGMSGQKFLELATSGQYRSDYEPAGSTNLEGLLYPDTYLLSSSDTEVTLLQRMINEFENEARLIGLDSSESAIAHTPYETVIIASMIEAEAKVPQDRGMISQVIQNRLFKAMPLQIDSTVLYALGNTKTSLSNSDLKVNSPFNTYQHIGLPPAPICSPGQASLEAALQPTPGPWLYYVVTGTDGSSSFSTTLQQQQQNIKLAKSRGLL